MGIPHQGYYQWPHAPSHLFVPGVCYFVTAATYQKELLFRDPQRLTLLQNTLFEQALAFGWQLEAWAILANHYHFVAQAPQDARTLPGMLKAVHSITAEVVNASDGTQGRQVWYQYRDTCLSYPESYFARLNYVHRNPVKHRLVKRAEEYRWCSMSWFVTEGKPSFSRMVLSFPCERIRVWDDF